MIVKIKLIKHTQSNKHMASDTITLFANPANQRSTLDAIHLWSGEEPWLQQQFTSTLTKLKTLDMTQTIYGAGVPAKLWWYMRGSSNSDGVRWCCIVLVSCFWSSVSFKLKSFCANLNVDKNHNDHSQRLLVGSLGRHGLQSLINAE